MVAYLTALCDKYPICSIEDGMAEEDWEGCLSIPDIRGKVPRFVDIRIQALDRQGKTLSMTASGFPARGIQHETDHLDGVLFFDQMKTFNSLTFLDEYARFWAKDDTI